MQTGTSTDEKFKHIPGNRHVRSKSSLAPVSHSINVLQLFNAKWY